MFRLPATQKIDDHRGEGILVENNSYQMDLEFGVEFVRTLRHTEASRQARLEFSQKHTLRVGTHRGRRGFVRLRIGLGAVEALSSPAQLHPP